MTKDDLARIHAVGDEEVCLLGRELSQLAVRGDRAANLGSNAGGGNHDLLLAGSNLGLLARNLTDDAGLDVCAVDAVLELIQERLLDLLDRGVLDPRRVVALEVKAGGAQDVEARRLGEVLQGLHVTAHTDAAHLDNAVDASGLDALHLGEQQVGIGKDRVLIVANTSKVHRKVLVGHRNPKL